MTAKLRFGVLGCSEFAGRAMIPAMKEAGNVDVVAVASRDGKKAREFAAKFGCEGVAGYAELISNKNIDAIYCPLPPGLHEEWVAKSLRAGKHVLVEKPFTTTEKATLELLKTAKRAKLLAMENFQFEHHALFARVKELLAAGAIGEVRLYRSAFTIPALPDDNFRYQESMGGGAALDMGSYMVRFALAFVGEPLTLVAAASRRDPKRGVDVFGTFELKTGDGRCAQLAYGFDTHYQNVWEFLGSKGKLTAERGFTAPPTLAPVIRLETAKGVETIAVPADNHYRNICRAFSRTILEKRPFEPAWEMASRQAHWLARIRKEALPL